MGDTKEPTVVIAQLLKRLYPTNPDIVLGREARNIVQALEMAGLRILPADSFEWSEHEAEWAFEACDKRLARDAKAALDQSLGG